MKGKLTKFAAGWKSDCIKRFTEKKKTLLTAVKDYNDAPDDVSNEKLTELFGNINVAQNAYNVEIDDARSFVGHVSQSLGNYFQTRPTDWQESSKGVDYNTWKEAFEDVSFDKIDILGHKKVGDEIKVDEGMLNQDEILQGLPDAVVATAAAVSGPPTEAPSEAPEVPPTPSPEAEAHAAHASATHAHKSKK